MFTSLNRLGSISQIAPIVQQVVQQSQKYDLIYANTLKALVVGAFASFFGRCPLVFHLHDILCPEHFSKVNQRVVVTLSNLFASRVIAVSEATRNAFIAAGGKADRIEVVYNGFEPEHYQWHKSIEIKLIISPLSAAFWIQIARLLFAKCDRFADG